MMLNTGIICAVCVFGTLVCGLVARSFITFVITRDAPPHGQSETALVAIAWVCALALIAITVIVCVSIGYLGYKP